MNTFFLSHRQWNDDLDKYSVNPNEIRCPAKATDFTMQRRQIEFSWKMLPEAYSISFRFQMALHFQTKFDKTLQLWFPSYWHHTKQDRFITTEVVNMKDNGLPYSLIHNDAIASCMYQKRCSTSITSQGTGTRALVHWIPIAQSPKIMVRRVSLLNCR